MSKVVFVSIGLFVNDINSDSLSLWMQERVEDGPLNGMWEFPGGKIEENESPIEGVEREIKEETGVLISKSFHFQTYQYEYNNKKICLHTFLINGNYPLPNHGKWFKIKYMDKSAYLDGKIPKINHKIIDDVANYIEILFSCKRIKMIFGEEPNIKEDF